MTPEERADLADLDRDLTEAEDRATAWEAWKALCDGPDKPEVTA